MIGGYVLDFSQATFVEYLASAGIDINFERYAAEGSSNATRLGTLWRLCSDTDVSAALRILAARGERT